MKSLGTIPSLGLVNVSGMSKKSQEAAPKCLSLQTFRRWVMIQVYDYSIQGQRQLSTVVLGCELRQDHLKVLQECMCPRSSTGRKNQPSSQKGRIHVQKVPFKALWYYIETAGNHVAFQKPQKLFSEKNLGLGADWFTLLLVNGEREVMILSLFK